MKIEKAKCLTPDFAEETVKKIFELVPECRDESGKIDFDKLKQSLSSQVLDGNVERYEFTWPGKRAAKAAASAATTKTLRPYPKESVNYDTTGNLYIEGDNLEVLKLLQTSYAGKVKMIYIDPPYNTGHDFVYRDRFSLTDKELAEQGGAFDEDGNRFDVNDSSEARYHSNWCSMMYPRLKLARNLLKPEGVLFMSIDDNEVVNARKLCDEIFGEANFIAQAIVKRSTNGMGDKKGFALNHDYLLAYQKSESAEFYGLTPDIEYLATFNQEDEHGKYKVDGILMKKGAGSRREDSPTLFFPIYYSQTTGEVSIERKEGFVERLPIKSNGTDGRWTWGREKISKESYRLYASPNGTIYVKDYLTPDRRMKIKTILEDSAFLTDRAANEITDLFEKKVFDTPKPIGLIKQILDIATNKDCIVIDFFSGSCTTAHAVMQLNAEDGGTRKFIMVQLPEVCPEDSEAAKAGYKNICEIGKERIRRAGKKIIEEVRSKSEEVRSSEFSVQSSESAKGRRKNKEGGSETGDLFSEGEVLESHESAAPCEIKYPDVGFRVLKLDSSSLNDTSATVEETTQVFENFARVKYGRTSEDLLFQMLLETHIPLSDKIVKSEVGGNEVFFVGVEAAVSSKPPYQPPLLACLDEKAKMTSDFFMEVAKLKPGIAFFRDDAFADDSARTNLQQAFNQFSANTSIKVI